MLIGFLSRKTGIPFDVLCDGVSSGTLVAVIQEFEQKVRETNGSILW